MDSLSCCCTAFYNIGMASTMTPAQIKAKYVHLMGPQAGEAFAELMQDAARLHLKWNEFLALFGVGPGQIDTLNEAAPGFFYLVSEAWWDGLILHIFRMTDGNRKVLSLVTLTKLLPTVVRSGYEPKLKLALAASRFAHDVSADAVHKLGHVGLCGTNSSFLVSRPSARSGQLRRANRAHLSALFIVARANGKPPISTLRRGGPPLDASQCNESEGKGGNANAGAPFPQDRLHRARRSKYVGVRRRVRVAIWNLLSMLHFAGAHWAALCAAPRHRPCRCRCRCQ